MSITLLVLGWMMFLSVREKLVRISVKKFVLYNYELNYVYGCFVNI